MVSKLNISMLYLICCVLVSSLLTRTRAELFTAISEMEPLLETHKRIIDDLDHYIEKEEKRLMTLKKHLIIYKREHEKAMDDIPNYLGNPINAFTLIKRLTTDLDQIEHSIKIGTEYIKNVTINYDDVKYPSNEDLTGAAQALIRLQDTYHLDVSELSQGVLNGVTYSTPMTASDCYELGRSLYNDKDYRNALVWMMETLRKYQEEDELYPFDEVDIMEYIGFSHYMLGDIRTALEWTKKLLKIDPDHPRARGNIPHYMKEIEEEDIKLKRRLRGETGEETKEKDPEVVEPELTEYQKDRRNYEALCRGDMHLPTYFTKNLHCRYMTENHPFLKLARVKMEIIYLNPDVIVFHDVMNDNEIEFVKTLAKPRLELLHTIVVFPTSEVTTVVDMSAGTVDLYRHQFFKRAVVHDPRTGELVPANYRISKSAWLRDEESDVIARISQRVADITGLSMDTAEELQVVNYGIGGHYEPHFDFARKQENAFKKFSGNRIATVLFYMSEVAQGGATVFTRLGLSVFPVKGAALFWMNLHPSGEGDLSTRHAACPVLRGSKWVSNKWIHQGGQELLKPCDLEYQDEAYMRKIPRPVPKTSR